MSRTFASIFLATCGLALAALPAAAQTSCGAVSNWCVFYNDSVQPPVIGVANGSYRAAGWRVLIGPFAEGWIAWREACRYHYSGRYRSPDIVAYRIHCPSCQRGPAGCAR